MDNLELPRTVHLYVEQNIGSDQVDVGYEIVMLKVEDGFSLKWNRAEPKPTEEQLESVYTAWKTEYDAKAYARARETAYPSVTDFMEAYTEKEIGSVSTKWDAYVIAYNKVRTDNPKS